eukprot:6111899-Amphidinium_carterae.2
MENTAKMEHSRKTKSGFCRVTWSFGGTTTDSSVTVVCKQKYFKPTQFAEAMPKPVLDINALGT